MKKRKRTPQWFGFLDAGKSSSPVVQDSSLNTGNPATIYLFNLMRGRILEYRKDIVELSTSRAGARGKHDGQGSPGCVSGGEDRFHTARGSSLHVVGTSATESTAGA